MKLRHGYMDDYGRTPSRGLNLSSLTEAHYYLIVCRMMPLLLLEESEMRLVGTLIIVGCVFFSFSSPTI